MQEDPKNISQVTGEKAQWEKNKYNENGSKVHLCKLKCYISPLLKVKETLTSDIHYRIRNTEYRKH